ncbi:MAG: type IV pilus biogenesis/stability protein PilW [Sphaerochaeta sp.]|uniref:tetratricopeptide repeat protein n=3 Tax=Sphaerochaeta sp. TaxID=1972642 RepID=UPI003D0C2976
MKHMLRFVLVAMMVFLLTSCATTVTVRHLVPAQVDLSGQRSLAVASTDAFRFPYGRPLSPWISGLQETDFTLSSGYDTRLATQVSESATSLIREAVDNTGYFTVLPPKVTDAYQTLSKTGEDVFQLLLDKGMKALLTSEISYMDVDESIVGRDVRQFVTEGGKTYEKVTSREYYLVQKATLTLTYSLYDLASKHILISQSFTDKQERETKVGIRTYTSDGYQDQRLYSSGYAPSFLPLFQTILDRFSSTISRQLAPYYETKHLVLMPNKPKLEIAKDAYTWAERGEYERAYDRFASIYQSSHQLSAGYNAALMLEALGRLPEAVDLMNALYNGSGSPQAYKELLRMQQTLSQEEKAQRQINGDQERDGQGVTMTQFVTME